MARASHVAVRSPAGQAPTRACTLAIGARSRRGMCGCLRGRLLPGARPGAGDNYTKNPAGVRNSRITMNKKKVLLALALLGLIVLFFVLGGPAWFDLESFQARREALQVYVDEHFLTSAL